MQYSILNNKVTIYSTDDFNPYHTLECGQTFRYERTETGYKIFSKNLFCSLIYDNGHVIIVSNDADYFINFFDLNRNYGIIKEKLSENPFLKEPIRYGSGIRILNQDPVETIISFIVSANNNIPRIKGIIERLCAAAGENMGSYHAFPTLKTLASKDISFYRSLGLGYRAEYIVKTSNELYGGFPLVSGEMSTAEARTHLMKLSGVGRKVADCVLLFAYHRTDAFPTDVWIDRVYDSLYGVSKLSRQEKAEKLSNKFGELSGYAQQYLFFHARETHNIVKQPKNITGMEEIS